MSDGKKRRYIGGGIGVGAALGILFGTLLGGDIAFVMPFAVKKFRHG